MPLSSNLPTKISILDSASTDAFSRLRVSGPFTVFDSQAQYGNSDLIWETLAAGTGAISNSLDESSVVLSTGGTASGASIIRQTQVYNRYQPGHSQMVLATFVMGEPHTNAVSEIGYYDDENGIFLQRDGSTVYVVKRTYVSGSAVDNKVEQSDWNIDKMDGTGPSKVNLDLTKSQILIIDLQWLGVGRVRFGFDIDGMIYYVHQFTHANILETPYMTTANLPMRARVYNSDVASGTATLKHICCCVMSEGGFEDQRAYQFSANRGATSLAVTTRRPALSLRAKATGPNGVRNTAQIVLETFQIIASTNSCLYELVLNGSLTDDSFSAFNASYSIAEVDVAATAISGGLVIDSGFIPADAGGFFGGGSSGSTQGDIFKKLPLVYTGLNNVQNTISLVMTSVTGTSDVNTSVVWKEFA